MGSRSDVTMEDGRTNSNHTTIALVESDQGNVNTLDAIGEISKTLQ